MVSILLEILGPIQYYRHPILVGVPNQSLMRTHHKGLDVAIFLELAQSVFEFPFSLLGDLVDLLDLGEDFVSRVMRVRVGFQAHDVGLGVGHEVLIERLVSRLQFGVDARIALAESLLGFLLSIRRLEREVVVIHVSDRRGLYGASL